MKINDSREDILNKEVSVIMTVKEILALGMLLGSMNYLDRTKYIKESLDTFHINGTSVAELEHILGADGMYDELSEYLKIFSFGV